MPAPIPALSQRPSHRRRLNVIALWLFLICGGAMAAPGRNVLVLYSNGRLVPGNVEVEGALGDAIHSTIARPVHINSEFLDRPEFVSDAYEQVMTSYLRDKYVEHPPHVVVAIGRDALDRRSGSVQAAFVLGNLPHGP